MSNLFEIVQYDRSLCQTGILAQTGEDMGAILVYREDKLLKVHDLSTVGATAIGRHLLNDIHLPDPARKVSRFHMAIFQDADSHCW